MISFGEPNQIWPEGTVVDGRFVIERELGRGGFGTTYLARHLPGRWTRVIKRLHSQYSEDSEYVRKFVQEAGAIERLRDCPQVVRIHDMFKTSDGHLAILMEYMEGGDLAKRIREQGQLSVEESVHYGLEIAKALSRAHAAGLVHRDVKPSNILLGKDPKVAKLADFGIVTEHDTAQPVTAIQRGSVGYAPLEQYLLPGKDLDGRTDLYALGATMYKMLAGRMPYGNVRTDVEWANAIKKGPAAPIERSDVPPELTRLILKMLEVDRENRPANADVVIGQLTPINGPAVAPRRGIIVSARDLPEVPTLKMPRSDYRRRHRFSEIKRIIEQIRAAWLPPIPSGLGDRSRSHHEE